jgi:hypothetical protein
MFTIIYCTYTPKQNGLKVCIAVQARVLRNVSVRKGLLIEQTKQQRQCERSLELLEKQRGATARFFATAHATSLFSLTHKAREIIVIHHGIANHGHLDVGNGRLWKRH